MVISNAPLLGGFSFPVILIDGLYFLIIFDTRSNSGP